MSTAKRVAATTAALTVPEAIVALHNSKHHITTADERQMVQSVHGEQVSSWRAHRRYSSTLTRHFLEDVHAYFRAAFQQVLSQAEKNNKTVNVPLFRRAVDNLTGHHRMEDMHVFPMFASHYPEMSSHFSFLEEDHTYLHPLEERVFKNGDFDALKEFVEFLIDHLNREEMVLVPMMLEGNVM